MHVIWFKRDLRLHDHAALCAAAAAGQVCGLYVIEPDYWQLPDTSARQWLFVRECLDELQQACKKAGIPLLIYSGSAEEALSWLHARQPLSALYSHEETGNNWTFMRDKAVKQWCRRHRVAWHEYRQFGVVRGQFNRGEGGKDAWAAQWDALMAQPQLKVPSAIHAAPIALPDINLPDAQALNLRDDGLQSELLQAPGREAGVRLLDSFLHNRGENYQTDMSSPLLGETGCSRLSPYIAYGCLSVREIYQAALTRQRQLREAAPPERGRWPRAVNAFIGRLHWHCHFMQKLESQPDIEFHNMNRAFDALERTTDTRLFEAWARGQTGYPFVDACMRSLIATGWLNFRMRAMLMSFASYHLWLDWRLTAPYLARMFTDYEPGIHYPQVQMQSGVTGINTVRMYNPLKQGADYDPDAVFIKRWVPELTNLPPQWCHQPWEIPPAEALMYGFELGREYPHPVVDEKQARKQAMDKIFAIKKTTTARTAARQVFERHGSRKKQAQAAKTRTRQQAFDF